MNEQTNQLLRELAEKLGTTSEYLWQVLVKQAHIYAWTMIICGGIPFLIGVVVALWVVKKVKGNKGKTEEWHFWVFAAALTISAISLVGMLINSQMIIAGLFNPEYWALKQILK